MQQVIKYNKGLRFLLCAVNIYSKYVWVIALKDKKLITITKVFQKVLNESGPKPNKVWVDRGGEFYNRSMKSWLQDNHTEMYSTHNDGKSVAERFIKTLQNKIYKDMSSVSRICTLINWMT